MKEPVRSSGEHHVRPAGARGRQGDGDLEASGHGIVPPLYIYADRSDRTGDVGASA